MLPSQQLDSAARQASDSGGSDGAGPSGGGGATANGGASSSSAERASSVTLAAELLGMPSLPQNYSAKVGGVPENVLDGSTRCGDILSADCWVRLCHVADDTISASVPLKQAP